MYVIVHHRFTNPASAFERGMKLIKNEGAPAGTTGLQFYPSRDGLQAICLWDSDSVTDIQAYVDDTLGDASVNTCWEIDGDHAFADRPLGLPTSAAVRG
jgi:hypothetical protein